MPTVVVADDERPERFLLRELFESHGCRVLEAADGAEAYALIRAEKPDLVVMDMKMPNVSGEAAVNVVRETIATARTAIIICSGKERSEVENSVSLGPLTRFHQKPVNLDELWALAQELLGAK